MINVNIMDVPTPPLSVFVDNVYQDNCIVHWSPPKDDGGTEIKKYIVEQLDNTTGNGNWTECAQSPSGKERQIKVEHLIPMHKYRFRVRAANKIGPSEPTEMTGPDIVAKDPWGKLLLEQLHDKNSVTNEDTVLAKTIKENRLLLCWVMTRHGTAPLSAEWAPHHHPFKIIATLNSPSDVD